MVPILRSLSILLLTTSAAGRVFPGTPYPGSDPDYTTADRNSNYTHTVTFKHSDRADAGTWQWTLRVSEVPAYKYSENYAPGFHQAYTTYSFAWPGNGTLNDALQNELEQDPSLARTGSCAVLLTILFPPEISATYDDSSSDCTSMLDEFCVAALKRMVEDVEFDDQLGKCRFSDNGFQAVGGLACREYTEPNYMGGLAGTVARESHNPFPFVTPFYRHSTDSSCGQHSAITAAPQTQPPPPSWRVNPSLPPRAVRTRRITRRCLSAWLRMCMSSASRVAFRR